jgi:hypothetical protein
VNHHRIPEAHLQLFVNRDRAKDIIRARREHLPGGEFADTVGRFQCCGAGACEALT